MPSNGGQIRQTKQVGSISLLRVPILVPSGCKRHFGPEAAVMVIFRRYFFYGTYDAFWQVSSFYLARHSKVLSPYRLVFLLLDDGGHR